MEIEVSGIIGEEQKNDPDNYEWLNGVAGKPPKTKAGKTLSDFSRFIT